VVTKRTLARSSVRICKNLDVIYWKCGAIKQLKEKKWLQAYTSVYEAVFIDMRKRAIRSKER
jgi:hypothetical protein